MRNPCPRGTLVGGLLGVPQDDFARRLPSRRGEVGRRRQGLDGDLVCSLSGFLDGMLEVEGRGKSLLGVFV